MTRASIRIGILGASGYTGAELVRLLGDHPRAEIRALTAERHAGKPIGEVFPQLAVHDLPPLVKIDEVDVGALDVLFCCLPHATTQAIVAALPRGPKIVDLGAWFTSGGIVPQRRSVRNPCRVGSADTRVWNKVPAESLRCPPAVS